jgi:16S rRNA (cytidine1402-2'-O)-methyltransferase
MSRSKTNNAGKLFVVGTPIGNLSDITIRAIETLKQVDLIACEDTRVTRKLLNRYEIATRTISYHKFNERERSRVILEKLEQGESVALVTDAGMPAVSDPGCILVNDVHEHGLKIEIVPGPSSITSAVALSGIDSSSFLFVGFLPPKESERTKTLVELKYERNAIVCFESTSRILKSLKTIGRIFGDRKLAVVKELTKIHETVFRGSAEEIIDQIGPEPKGEFVVVISPHTGEEEWGGLDPVKQIRYLSDQLGIAEKEALKIVVRLRKLDRSETYKKLIDDKNAGGLI